MTAFERISKILIALSGVETITIENTLQDDLTLDSLHMVMLLVEIEDEFEITLEESDMNPFDLITVQDVVALVYKYCGDDHEKDN